MGRRRPWRWSVGILVPSIAALVVAASSAAADAPGEPTTTTAGEVSGGGDAAGPFSLTAPAGWVMNRRPGDGVRRRTVFYPRGSGGADAPVKVFVNTSPRGPGGTLDALVERDVKSTLERAQGARVSEETSLRTADSKLALVRSFAGGDGEESVAYIAEKDSFILITLSASDEQRHAEGESAFRAIVESYRAAER